MGIALEVYDFTTFSYFAIAIAHTFFPSDSQFLSLMLSLGTVGAGFVTRPFGAFIIGRYADKVGRTPAMILSFALMGVAIVGLCATPSYAQIGVAAPLLVLTFRLIQGFALGGEVGSTTAFLLEAAPVEQRGRYCSLQYCSQGVAAVFAGIVGAVLASILGTQALESYGWRIAMVLGAAVLPIGWVLRRSMPETLQREVVAEPSQARIAAPRIDPKVLSLFYFALVIIGAEAAGSQVLRYMTTYSMAFLHLHASAALGVQGISGVLIIISVVLGGALSDVIGRRPVMIGAEALCTISLLPAFFWLVHMPSTVSLFASVAIWTMFAGFSAGATLVALTEALPPHVRSTTFALAYAVAQAFFGSSTQPLITWLIHTTHDPLMPGWCAFAASAVALAAKSGLSETAPRRLRHASAVSIAS